MGVLHRKSRRCRPGNTLTWHRRGAPGSKGGWTGNREPRADGPFVEAKEIVGGDSIVEADTLEAATQRAHGCPALLSGGSVEIRPLAGFSIKA
jgi:hypothetical protein